MRELEQIEGILQTWPEGFKERFGRKLRKEEFVEYLTDLKRRKELESIRNQFETFHVREIDLLLKCLGQREFENIDSEVKNKNKKGK